MSANGRILSQVMNNYCEVNQSHFLCGDFLIFAGGGLIAILVTAYLYTLLSELFYQDNRSRVKRALSNKSFMEWFKSKNNLVQVSFFSLVVTWISPLPFFVDIPLSIFGVYILVIAKRLQSEKLAE